MKREEREEEAEEEARRAQGQDPMADQVVEESLHFLYPISRYIYRKARAHYHQHKHAFAPMPKSKITRWFWDLKTVVICSMAIFVQV